MNLYWEIILFNSDKELMQTFSEIEWKEYEQYFFLAAEIAKKATCQRSKCGCVIVKNWKIIWQWFNSPARDLESQRRCTCDKKSYDFKVTDKTCCIHAEQRAMFDALRNYPNEIIDSELFFIRLDSDWNMGKSWDPYCTICSKMALDLWVKYFYLWHDEGITRYDTQEYNTLSYQYKG